MYIKVSHREAARLFARGRVIYDDNQWGTCFQALAPARTLAKCAGGIGIMVYTCGRRRKPSYINQVLDT